MALSGFGDFVANVVLKLVLDEKVGKDINEIQRILLKKRRAEASFVKLLLERIVTSFDF